jgi:hypothetical protein
MELCGSGRPRCGCLIRGGASRGPTAQRAWPDRGRHHGQVAATNRSDQYHHESGTGRRSDDDKFDDHCPREVARFGGAVHGQVVENLDAARLGPLPCVDHDPDDTFTGDGDDDDTGHGSDDAGHGDDDDGTDQPADDNDTRAANHNDSAAAAADHDDDRTTNDGAINDNHDVAAWSVT